MKLPATLLAILVLAGGSFGEARVVRLRIEKRMTLLEGKSFGLAGPFEKLSGRVELALDPDAPANTGIVGLALAERNASGEVELEVGKPFTVLVPAVDEDGNDRAGIRLPEIAAPLATYTGWNYRHPAVGAPDRLSSEIGAYFAFSRASIEKRYRNRDEYLGRVAAAALGLVDSGYLLVSDLPAVLARARAHYDWATGPRS